MPHIKLNTTTGDVAFHYNIATPTSPSSPTINCELPSILFIHGEYMGEEVFEAQFADAQLRLHFNLIGLDLRGFGKTGGVVGKGTYTPVSAADDIHIFLQTMRIPSVHVFSISIGCHVGLELAFAYPDIVESLTLCTMPPAKEPPEVKAGRLEVYDYWNDSSNHEGSPDTETDLDEDLLLPLVRGVKLMMFGETASSLADALTMHALKYARINWAGSPELLKSSRVLLIDWFLERKVFNVKTLKKIVCPITLIHCMDDIAYPLSHTQEFESLLRKAGHKDVALFEVSGAHFGNVTYSHLINPILRDRVLSVVSSDIPPAEDSIISPSFVTPYTEELAQFGYPDDEDELVINLMEQKLP